MGRVNDRQAPRVTKRFDSQKLARLAEEPPEPAVEPMVDHIAPHGTEPTRLAAGTEPPIDLRSRTTTVHDPLTTGVLAEVARRQVEDAKQGRDDDDLPPASPRLIKRR